MEHCMDKAARSIDRGFFSDLLKWTLLWVLAVLLMFLAVAVFLFDSLITTGIAVVIGLSGVATIVYAILKRLLIENSR